MGTLNIQFLDKIRKFPEIFVSCSYRKNFVGTQKQVRNSHGKRAIGVGAIEVLLYLNKKSEKFCEIVMSKLFCTKWVKNEMRL